MYEAFWLAQASTVHFFKYSISFPEYRSLLFQHFLVSEKTIRLFFNVRQDSWKFCVPRDNSTQYSTIVLSVHNYKMSQALLTNNNCDELRIGVKDRFQKPFTSWNPLHVFRLYKLFSWYFSRNIAWELALIIASMSWT